MDATLQVVDYNVTTRKVLGLRCGTWLEGDVQVRVLLQEAYGMALCKPVGSFARVGLFAAFLLRVMLESFLQIQLYLLLVAHRTDATPKVIREIQGTTFLHLLHSARLRPSAVNDEKCLRWNVAILSRCGVKAINMLS